MFDLRQSTEPPHNNHLRRPIYHVTIQRLRTPRSSSHGDRINQPNTLSGTSWIGKIIVSCTGAFVALVLLGFLAYLGLFGIAAYFILSHF
jgi:hypothetical protein